METRCDFLIVGAGIIGLTVARALLEKHPQCKIVIIDKEKSVGRHQSGRNSGVIHSGIYYPEDTLKAKVCVEGAELLRNHCKHKGLPYQECGKVIVPTSEEEEPQLDLLFDRASKNGVTIERIDAQQLHELEPEAQSATGRALFSPRTAVIDSQAVLVSLISDLERVSFVWNCEYVRPIPKMKKAKTTQGEIHYGHLINCAGLQADQVARELGVGRQYEVLPFKGLYYELSPKSGLKIGRLIYPVPDLRVPFLGVHFTTSVKDRVFIGPTAIPAAGRENYDWAQGIEWTDAPRKFFRIASQYLANRDGFRHFTHQEGFRFFKPFFVNAAQALVPKIRASHLLPSPKVGIRAQLFHKANRKLEMDFVIEKGSNSTHVLNAVSPAFTASMSFAQVVLEEMSAEL